MVSFHARPIASRSRFSSRESAFHPEDFIDPEDPEFHPEVFLLIECLFYLFHGVHLVQVFFWKTIT